MSMDDRTERFLGIALPLAICVYALYGVWDGQIEIWTRRGVLVLTGLDMWLAVVAVLGGAGVLHAAWYWANTQCDAGYSQLGQVVGLIVVVGSLALLLARQFGQFL